MPPLIKKIQLTSSREIRIKNEQHFSIPEIARKFQEKNVHQILGILSNDLLSCSPDLKVYQHALMENLISLGNFQKENET